MSLASRAVKRLRELYRVVLWRSRLANARLMAYPRRWPGLACAVAEELEPFVPDGARRLRTQLTSGEPKPSPAFPRLQR